MIRITFFYQKRKIAQRIFRRNILNNNFTFIEMYTRGVKQKKSKSESHPALWICLFFWVKNESPGRKNKSNDI